MYYINRLGMFFSGYGYTQFWDANLPIFHPWSIKYTQPCFHPGFFYNPGTIQLCPSSITKVFHTKTFTQSNLYSDLQGVKSMRLNCIYCWDSVLVSSLAFADVSISSLVSHLQWLRLHVHVHTTQEPWMYSMEVPSNSTACLLIHYIMPKRLPL